MGIRVGGDDTVGRQVVGGCPDDDVMGLEDRVRDEFAGVLVDEAVKGSIALLPRRDNFAPPQLGQVLGNHGRVRRDR